MNRFTHFGLLLLCLAAYPAAAAPIKICDVQPLIDYGDCDCEPYLPANLPIGIFDFSQKPALGSITGFHFQMTMEDGDTAPGDMDFGNLSLQLDGIDTGIKLNGFKASEELTLEFSIGPDSPGWSQQAAAAIFQELQKDGELIASIADATPEDNYVNLYSAFDAKLCILGEPGPPNPIPEPGSVAIWLLGALGCGYGRRLASSRGRQVT